MPTPRREQIAIGAVGKTGDRDAEVTLTRFAQAGIDIDALAQQLQHEGAESFVKSWKQLLQRIAEKSVALARAS